MNQKYKIFGERNCGTNLLRSLVADERFLPDDTGLTTSRLLNKIALNFGRMSPKYYDQFYDYCTTERHLSIQGWKHASPRPSSLKNNNIRPVMIVKHPAFWMQSFWKKPFHHYSKTSVYRPRKIENIGANFIELEQLILLKLKSYRDTFEMCGGIVVQYESLIAFPNECRGRLKDIFGHCADIPNSDVRNFVKSDSNRFSTKYSQEALRDLDNFSNSRLNESAELLNFFGYGQKTWLKTLPFSS